MPGQTSQDHGYAEAVSQFGAAIERLVRGYEADAEKRRDLSQEIHLQLWRSLQRFDGRCSLRTWVYRVAHNVAASHVVRERRSFAKLVDLDELGAEMRSLSEPGATEVLDRARNLERLTLLIRRLKPLDRQVILAYLEEMDAVSIAEITGLSPAYVAVRVHRIQSLLARQFNDRS